MKQRLIVIVPGSKPKASSSALLNKLLERFYMHFGVDTENNDVWISELKQIFLRGEPQTEVLIFNWSGGITKTFSLNKAAQELYLLIAKNRDREIVLFCKSLGGIVGEIAARKYARKIKIIEVATPRSPFKSKIPEAEVINIYSPEDKYLNFANKILFCGFGKSHLAHAKNIALPNIGHSALNKNIEIDYKGIKMPLFEFYKQIINA